jgi:folylpolyglutamate synthase/dihydropteroate synthase
VIDLCRTPRAMPAEHLISEVGPDRVTARGTFSDVWKETLRRCQPGDRIVVFGSVHTVSEALALLG